MRVGVRWKEEEESVRIVASEEEEDLSQRVTVRERGRPLQGDLCVAEGRKRKREGLQLLLLMQDKSLLMIQSPGNHYIIMTSSLCNDYFIYQSRRSYMDEGRWIRVGGCRRNGRPAVSRPIRFHSQFHFLDDGREKPSQIGTNEATAAILIGQG